MKRVMVLLAGVAWAFLVFVCTGYLSFPGDALAERAEYEIHQGSRKQYIAELGDLSPWWLGLSTGELKLFGKADRKGNTPLLVYATDARISANPLSLLMRAPSVAGSITLGDNGTLYYEVATTSSKDQLVPASVELTGDGFPINELLTMIPNAQVAGSGDIDINVKLKMPDGMAQANGKISLLGKGMTLIKPVFGDFPLGQDVVISELDLQLSIKDGKAKVSRGKLKSDVANISITGNIVLNDVFGSSQVDLKLEVEPAETFSVIKQVFPKAVKNGKVQFTCRGPISAIDRACKAGNGAAAKKARPRTPARPAIKGAKPSMRSPVSSKADRDKRKKELQERLRKRREERRKAGKNKAGGPDGDPMGAGDEEDDEELPPEDEEGSEDDGGGEDDEEFVEE